MVGKINYETAGIKVVAIKVLVGLKPKIYFFLIDDSSESKKAKSVNRNLAEI